MNMRNLIFPYQTSVLYLYTISCIILKSNLIYANVLQTMLLYALIMARFLMLAQRRLLNLYCMVIIISMGY